MLFLADLSPDVLFLALSFLDQVFLFLPSLINFGNFLLEFSRIVESTIFLSHEIVQLLLDLCLSALILPQFLLDLVDVFFEVSEGGLNVHLLTIDNSEFFVVL